MNPLLALPLGAAIAALPSTALAATLEPDPANFSLAWGFPFALILLSIALGPVLTPSLWQKHYGKIVALWSLIFLIPYAATFSVGAAGELLAEAMLSEYIPFILLLLTLFTVSGGILIVGDLRGTPKTNTRLLFIGTMLASLMGTTGAAMLMIRPALRALEHRTHKMHVVIFFIFLVANIGGSLTPLGDPPLFLGFLKGVTFSWTFLHMLLPFVFSVAFLLIVFFLLDSHLYKKSGDSAKAPPKAKTKIKVFGKLNVALLLCVVCTVVLSGVWKPGVSFRLWGVDVELQNLLRDAIFVGITAISLAFTPKPVRMGNEFDFEPIVEVAKLFVGIFITITPVIGILRAGEAGHLGFLVSMTHNAAGEPIDAMYFWMTGALSSFLDNAPTYLIFFNMASGDPEFLMHSLPETLRAISMGAVFMGAMTYIGNAPNLMVRAIANQREIEMPTFFGYMGWSLLFLGSLFILLTLIFFAV